MNDFVQEEKLSYLFGVNIGKDRQLFFFLCNEPDIYVGDKVIVEMDQDILIGDVSVIYDKDNPIAERITISDGKIVSRAEAKDLAANSENHLLAAEATAFCKTCIRQRELEMKLVDVEVLHDRSKIIFFFTAPVRIDFRELVKDLVRNYRTRIELRQIGVRHETQRLGGLGNCGNVCCCHGFLQKFAPVTIKMAKEQNLFLNPAKLSGLCGRLLCCLSFEHSNYEEFNKQCPRMGKKYQTEKGIIKPLRANMFSQSIVVCMENGEEREFSMEEWQEIRLIKSKNNNGDQAIVKNKEHTNSVSTKVNTTINDQNFAHSEANVENGKKSNQRQKRKRSN